jgi:NTE family protein
VLGRVDTLAAVSGGCLLAAWLASRVLDRFGAGGMPAGARFADFEAEVAAPFRGFTRSDLRTRPLARGLLPWNWVRPAARVRALAAAIEQRLVALRLGELPARPRLVLCATDLVFGVNWVFEKERMGDWRAGYLAPPPAEWPLARAVAASCCFPPLFAPLPLGLPADRFRGGAYAGSDRAALRERIALTDGGVYDNLGLEPVWKDHAVLLVSDGGGRLDFAWTANPLRRLARYSAVLQSQALALRKRWLISNFAAGVLDGAYWGVGSAVSRFGLPAGGLREGYSKRLALETIAAIRTDLDGFTAAEAAVLENHGYLLADAALRRHLPSLADPAAPTASAPHPDWLDEGRVRAALAASGRRFSLRRLLS